ncbi:hypothetical protein BDZ97DRAFT_1707222 [Flammula alnicola]|nr:hypothetical protein BDZ97DRAFT_1707222 [Flammula alnicola]
MSLSYNSVPEVATVTVNHKTPPEISDGALSPAVLQEWEDQCLAYFAKRKVVKEDEVREIVTSNCFKKDRIKHWIKTNRAKLLEPAYTFDTLLASLRKLFLVADWDQDILRTVVNAKMHPDESFEMYSTRVLRGNNLLTGTPSALNEEALRAMILLNVSDALAEAIRDLLTTELDHLKGLKEFEDWLKYIEKLDNGQRNTRRRAAEHTEMLINKRQRTGGRGRGGYGYGNRGGHSAPAQTFGGMKRAPPLMPEEREVLDRYAGCWKCRRFFVHHNSVDCMNGFPDGNGYQIRTEEMALAQMPSPPVAFVNVPPAQPAANTANATASASTSRIEDVTTPPHFSVNAVLPSTTSFVLGNGSPSTGDDSDDEAGDRD